MQPIIVDIMHINEVKKQCSMQNAMEAWLLKEMQTFPPSHLLKRARRFAGTIVLYGSRIAALRCDQS